MCSDLSTPTAMIQKSAGSGQDTKAVVMGVATSRLMASVNLRTELCGRYSTEKFQKDRRYVTNVTILCAVTQHTSNSARKDKTRTTSTYVTDGDTRERWSDKCVATTKWE